MPLGATLSTSYLSMANGMPRGGAFVVRGASRFLTTTYVTEALRSSCVWYTTLPRRTLGSRGMSRRGVRRWQARPKPSSRRGAAQRFGQVRARGLAIPNFPMRDRSVLDGMPRVLAAPASPSITQSTLSRTSRICWLSTSCRVRAASAPPTSYASGCRSSTGPWAEMRARSIRFSNSRTLPGHE